MRGLRTEGSVNELSTTSLPEGLLCGGDAGDSLQIGHKVDAGEACVREELNLVVERGCLCGNSLPDHLTELP